jgi:hypothetical protein
MTADTQSLSERLRVFTGAIFQEAADALDAKDALLAKAAAALERFAWDDKVAKKAREALDAIRGEVSESRHALADRIREATREAVMGKKPK